MDKKEAKPVNKFIFWQISVVVLIAAIVPVIFLYPKYQQIQLRFESLKELPPQEHAARVIEMVSKLVKLPQGENPQELTIADVTKLANQPFFTSAENGDEFLYYPNAKVMILYRPSTNQVINKNF